MFDVLKIHFIYSISRAQQDVYDLFNLPFCFGKRNIWMNSESCGQLFTRLFPTLIEHNIILLMFINCDIHCFAPVFSNSIILILSKPVSSFLAEVRHAAPIFIMKNLLVHLRTRILFY